MHRLVGVERGSIGEKAIAVIFDGFDQGGGNALRSFHLVPGWFIAFFYTGLGIALALAGVGFLVHYLRRDGYITCPVTGKVREG